MYSATYEFDRLTIYSLMDNSGLPVYFLIDYPLFGIRVDNFSRYRATHQKHEIPGPIP